MNLIVLGKLKEQYLRDAMAEYVKRLGAFANFKVIEIEECRLGDNPSEKEIEIALETEAKAIVKNLAKKTMAVSIAMCIEGRQMSSPEMSSYIMDKAVCGCSTINYIIGSSFGLADRVKSLCDIKLSMSKMTFPHQLARVMLTEQIYRAFQISSGGKYHK